MHAHAKHDPRTSPLDRQIGRIDSHAGGRHYVPAAGQHSRLPLYDLMAKLVGADAARRELIEQVAPRSGERVLDIGCGPGALAIGLARRFPGIAVVGIDPDPGALAIARRRAARASLDIRFEEGFADELPYADASFDRATSSLMFHHLDAGDKERALREVRRVLAPGGHFHMLDFDGPDPAGAGFVARRLHANRHLHDNAQDRVLELLGAAGFDDACVVGRRAGALAHIVYYEARAPRSPSIA